MKITNVLITTISLVTIIGCSNDNWKIYKENINVGFTIEFKIPSKMFSNRIENGMCIGEQSKN